MKGFTLIETLLTLGIFSLIVFLGSVSFVKIQKSYLLNDNVWQVASVIRKTQSQAAFGESTLSGRLKFGVLFSQNYYQQFATLTNFINRETSYDFINNLPRNLEFVNFNLTDNCSGSSDCIIFSSLEGTPSASGNITLRNKDLSQNKVIYINSQGNVYY